MPGPVRKIFGEEVVTTEVSTYDPATTTTTFTMTPGTMADKTQIDGAHRPERDRAAARSRGSRSTPGSRSSAPGPSWSASSSVRPATSRTKRSPSCGPSSGTEPTNDWQAVPTGCHLTWGPPAHIVWADRPSVAAREAHRTRQVGAWTRDRRRLPGGSKGVAHASGRPPGRPRLRGGDNKEVLTVAIRRGPCGHSRPGHRGQPFHVEQHGIDFIPESERWATPKDIFGMWAGASVQVEYFIYGAILMTFGFTFAQAVVIIVHRQPLLPPVGALLSAGPERRNDGVRHQPGPVRAQRLAAALVLQLGHPDRVRGGGPHPHRRSRRSCS